MRKDVRMGFAVGGVLLAVIIVAVLVIHRNKNSSKAVAFDPGKSALASSKDPASLESAPNAAESVAAPGSVQATDPAATPREAVAAAPDAKAAPDDIADKSGTRWDALFASSVDDPMKSKPTSGSAGSKSHAASRILAAKHDATDAVANGQIDAGTAPYVARSLPLSAAITPAAPRTSLSPARNGDSSQSHKIEPGETFVSIARAVYGDGRYFQAIVDANPTVAPEKLKPGMVIQLPPASQVKKAKAAKSASAAAPSGPALASDGKTYTVQNGDNLYKIAKKLYGKGEREGDLYTLNKQVIGPDSTKLKIGIVLRLPESSKATASH